MQTVDPYITWLQKTRSPVFESAGTWWRPYEGGLVPASTKPVPIQLKAGQAEALLRMSGSHLLRYFSRTIEAPSDFWYVSCADYDFEKLPGKMRTKIRRAYKDCTVRELDPVWLSKHGQECYYAAFARYKDGRPDSPEIFINRCCL